MPFLVNSCKQERPGNAGFGGPGVKFFRRLRLWCLLAMGLDWRSLRKPCAKLCEIFTQSPPKLVKEAQKLLPPSPSHLSAEGNPEIDQKELDFLFDTVDKDPQDTKKRPKAEAKSPSPPPSPPLPPKQGLGLEGLGC